MGKQADLRAMLAPYLTGPVGLAALESVLVAGSNLPGPRGNLELAAAFGDAVGERGPGPDVWGVLMAWTTLSAAEAPTNDPREFLPFCALQGLAALYRHESPTHQAAITGILRRAADDERWRLREAVAMALQRISEWDFATVQLTLWEWLDDATLAEQRAVVAALAHPPVLDRPERAAFCLAVSERLLQSVAKLDGAARRSPQFEVLTKGLSYAISVFVAAAPKEGFALLARWAVLPDVDSRRIVRANLGKARLAKRYTAEVAAVLALLDATPGSASPGAGG